MKIVAGCSIDASSNRTSAIQVRTKALVLIGLLLSLLSSLQLFSNPMLASGVVATCDQLSLQAALAGGGDVTFACSGVIVLTNTISIVTDTVLDGTGQSVTISGNDLVRIFYVSPNVNLTMKNLTLAHGNDIGAPGDLQTPGGSAKGGSMFIDRGVVNVADCQFNMNRATGGWASNNFQTSWAAGGAYGGAIYNRGGSLSVTNCTFLSNQTVAGVAAFFLPPPSGDGMGGAIYNEEGYVSSVGTRFIANAAQGGAPGFYYPGSTQTAIDGAAFGGAIYSTNGTLVLDNCVLSSNKTIVGPVTRDGQAAPAGGGAIYTDKGSIRLVSSVLSLNEVHGDGGWTSTEGNGGAIFNNGQLYVSECSFLSNSAIGASGLGGSSAGGAKPGNGGAIYSLSSATIAGSTFNANSAIGGHGFEYINGPSSGTNGNGGAIYCADKISLLNCTLFRNLASGGDGSGASSGGVPLTEGGPGNGGGIYASSGTVAITNLTFAENSAKGGKGGETFWPEHFKMPDGASQGGAFYVSTSAVVFVVNTIVANSLSGSNCFGALSDRGHNISSDDSCSFTATSSLNSTDSKLGPFGTYGGPTPTIPLLAGSPAIDAADAVACPEIDQRGIARPFGAGCDIGAFEFAPPALNGHVRGFLSPAGVVINVDSNSVPVDASGSYTFTGLAPGIHLVTPVAPDTRFVPGRRVIQVGPDATDVDFNAYQLNALAPETSTYGGLHVVFAGDLEGTYLTEVSTNCWAWSLYSTNRTDTNGIFTITKVNDGSGSRFFRVVRSRAAAVP